MVSIENRLLRMVESGKLTQAQADLVRVNSEVSKPDFGDISIRKKLPIYKIIGVSALLFMGFLAFSNTGGDTTQIEQIQNIAETINQPEGVGKMSNTIQNITSITIIFLPILLCVIIFMFLYNNIVSKEEDVMSSWSQVETNYQRRADLIPNLVNTVKGFADQEEEVLIGTTNARNKLLTAVNQLEEIKSNADELAVELDSEDKMAALAGIQAQVGAGMKSIFALAENYPNLKSSESFLTLQDQLEGTENRINITRMMFNDAVRDYNRTIRVLPSSVIANMSGFKRKAYFEADESAENKIDVNFKDKTGE